MEDSNQLASENTLTKVVQRDESLPLGFSTEKETMERVRNSPLSPFLRSKGLDPETFLLEESSASISTESIQGSSS